MKNVLILHGIQGHAGVHWQKWLHDELGKKDFKVIMPTLPNEMKPDRDECLRFVKKLVVGVDFSQLSMVGHSLGVVTALDFLEFLDEKVNKLISVSGFSKDYGAELNSYFLKEKSVDFTRVRENLRKVHVVYGDDDPYVPRGVLKKLANDLVTEPIVIKGGGHLNTDAGYTEFPLLLELLEK